MKPINISIVSIILIIILSSSCERKLIYSGDDLINSDPFKRNLLKKGGKWEVSREDVYYTDNLAQDYLGYKEAEIIGIIEFADEEPPITIAGSMGTWTPSGGQTTEILYQVSARSSIQIAVYVWEDGKTTDHQGYVAHLDWDKFSMTWGGHDNTHRGDTLVRHIYYFDNVGN